jgi:hypothetical protein
VRSTRAFLLGAGAAYFFDPRQGRRRRVVLRDRTAALMRRSARLGTKKLRFAGGHVRGLLAIGHRLVSPPPEARDDATVAQRIRSDALRGARVSTRDVQVAVEDGVATLHGAVGSSSIADDLVSRVRKVPGVRDVSALLRVENGDT